MYQPSHWVGGWKPFTGMRRTQSGGAGGQESDFCQSAFKVPAGDPASWRERDESTRRWSCR